MLGVRTGDCHTEGVINGYTHRNIDRSMRILGFAKLGIILLGLASKGARSLWQARRKSFPFLHIFVYPLHGFIVRAPMTSVTQKCFQDAWRSRQPWGHVHLGTLCSTASLVLCKVDRPSLSGQVRMRAGMAEEQATKGLARPQLPFWAANLFSCILSAATQTALCGSCLSHPTTSPVSKLPPYFQPPAQLSVLARQPMSCPTSPGMKAGSHTHPGLGQAGGLALQVGGWR